MKQGFETLFPDVNTQKSAFEAILEITNARKSIAKPKTLLALLRYSNGNVEEFRKAAWQSHPHFWMDEIEPFTFRRQLSLGHPLGAWVNFLTLSKYLT